MIKILDRYFFVLFFKNACLSLLGIGSLFFFQQFFMDLLSPEFRLDQALYYNSLFIPFVMTWMSPPSLLMATVLTLSQLTRSQELTAFYSLGVGLPRLLIFPALGVLGYSLLLSEVQNFILPELYKTRLLYLAREIKKRKDFFLDFKKEKIWFFSKNRIYHFGYFDHTHQSIHQLSVYQLGPQFQLEKVIHAPLALWKPSPSGSDWELQKGTETELGTPEDFPKTSSFDKKALSFSESIEDFQQLEREVDGLTNPVLAGYIHRMKNLGVNTKNYEVKYHARFSLSAANLILFLLGVPFSLSSRRSDGLAKDLGLCLGVTFLYWLFYSIGLSLGKSGWVSPFWGAWFPTFFFGGLALVLVTHKLGPVGFFKQKRSLFLGRNPTEASREQGM